MGYGDEIMASGFARGAAARGKRIAFGDGRRIINSRWSPEVFLHNPNIAHPGDERAADLEWCDYYVGHRRYVEMVPERYRFNLDFRAPRGEFYFGDAENVRRMTTAPGFVLIEPNVPQHKPVSVNKQWPVDRFQRVVDYLASDVRRVAQITYPEARHVLHGVETYAARDFRDACAVLSRAALYIGPDGGMHHAAAALGIPAVVIFGGFAPPRVLGYGTHINLTGGAEACGSIKRCDHCAAALDAITAEEVLHYGNRILRQRRR